MTCPAAARSRLRALAMLGFALMGAQRLSAQLPESVLSIRTARGEQVWWRSADAPQRWSAALPLVERAVRWWNVQPGLERGRLELAGGGVAWRISVVLARLDPARFRLELDTGDAWGGSAAWSIDRAGAAALALNAGQFRGSSPWGWVVHRGTELQPPGFGPLSAALVLDRQGRVDLLAPDEIASARVRGHVVEAVQSYPAILVGDGDVPEALRGPNRGVDLVHRDSRLAVCVTREGRLLFALTRFLSPASPLARLPFGPTTPEMAAIMGALGCRRAVLLDGGLSGQMAMRDQRGVSSRWPGLREVPLGLMARPR